jgi:hypothetical protein
MLLLGATSSLGTIATRVLATLELSSSNAYRL